MAMSDGSGTWANYETQIGSEKAGHAVAEGATASFLEVLISRDGLGGWQTVMAEAASMINHSHAVGSFGAGAGGIGAGEHLEHDRACADRLKAPRISWLSQRTTRRRLVGLSSVQASLKNKKRGACTEDKPTSRFRAVGLRLIGLASPVRGGNL